MDTKKLDFLDGIRGWGAMVVLLFHLFVDGLPVTYESTLLLELMFFFNGTLAVWVFFIVSGFSLSIGFTRTHDRSALLRTACGRYLRLALPILAFSLLMTLMMHLGWVPPVADRPSRYQIFLLTPPSLTDALSFSSWRVFFDYRDETSILPPLWTMPIELFGSFCVLGLCFFAGTHRLKPVIYTLAAIVTAAVDLYFTAFMIGLAFGEIYELQRSRSLRIPSWASLGAWVLGVILASKLPEAGKSLYLVVSTLLFFGMAFSSPIRRWFETPLSKFFGRISFTLYLLHPILIFSFSLSLLPLLQSRGSDEYPWWILCINLATVILSVALSVPLTWIDRVSIRLAKAFSNLVCSSFFRRYTR